MNEITFEEWTTYDGNDDDERVTYTALQGDNSAVITREYDTTHWFIIEASGDWLPLYGAIVLGNNFESMKEHFIRTIKHLDEDDSNGCS